MILSVLAVGGFTLVGASFTARSTALLAAALSSGWLLLALDGRSPSALGMPARAEGLFHAVLGLGLGTLVALVAVAALALAGAVRWTVEAGTLTQYLGAGAYTLAFLALPAAAEEAVLRGYPLQAVAEAWGPAVALASTSALFALLHAPNPGIGAASMANIFAAGLLLGALYLRTGSLWWAFGAHLGWNWAHGFGADLPVSGLDVVDTPLLEAHVSGSVLLSGGAFGPEGSLLSTGVVLAASAWVWTTRRLTPAGWTLEAPPLAPLRVLEMPQDGRAKAGREGGSSGR